MSYHAEVPAPIGVVAEPAFDGFVKELSAFVDEKLRIAADARGNQQVLVAIVVEVHEGAGMGIFPGTGAEPEVVSVDLSGGVGEHARVVRRVQINSVTQRVVVDEDVRHSVAVHVPYGDAVGGRAYVSQAGGVRLLDEQNLGPRLQHAKGQ